MKTTTEKNKAKEKTGLNVVEDLRYVEEKRRVTKLSNEKIKNEIRWSLAKMASAAVKGALCRILVKTDDDVNLRRSKKPVGTYIVYTTFNIHNELSWIFLLTSYTTTALQHFVTPPFEILLILHHV